jgi:hypothetical protein
MADKNSALCGGDNKVMTRSLADTGQTQMCVSLFGTQPEQVITWVTVWIVYFVSFNNTEYSA